MKKILSVFFAMAFLLFTGCVSENKNNDSTLTSRVIQQSPVATSTINENLWQTVVDNTYMVTAKPAYNIITIPVTPNTTYRLKVVGDAQLHIALYDGKTETRDPRTGNFAGWRYSHYSTLAMNVVKYNGVFKTDAYLKNLELLWGFSTTDPTVLDSTKNIEVKLEKYSGDSSIFSDMTPLPPY